MIGNKPKAPYDGGLSAGRLTGGENFSPSVTAYAVPPPSSEGGKGRVSL